MNRIIQYAIKERKTTLLIAVALIVYGLYNYYLLPKQENPDTTSPAAVITTVFPGASAVEVEEQVTKIVEEEAMALEGVDSIESISNNNVSIVIVKLKTEADSAKQWEELERLMRNMDSQLPLGVKKPAIETDLINSAGFIISLSDGFYSQLEQHAIDLKQQLQMVKGVRKVTIQGMREKQVMIDIDYSLLNQYDLSMEDIRDLLIAQNLNIPAGYLQDSGNVAVNVKGKFESLDEIGDLILTVSKDTGAMVQLKDIAKISMEHKEDERQYRHNGQDAILITGYFEENKNVIHIGDDVKKAIGDYQDTMADETALHDVLFQPEEVGNAVNDFIISLLQGMLFVLIVVFIGVGIRNALIIAMSIPLSICITLIVMKLTGIHIEQMSISGLIVALGILVDNSIVISDAIQVKLNEGLEKKEAAFRGAREQLVPVLTSTLTTLAAFAAITTLPGSAGEFVKSLPQVVFISLSASYVVAMLITPALGSLFFKARGPIDHQKRHRIRRFFHYILIRSFKHKIITTISSFALLGLAVLAALTLEIDLFPYADKDLMYVDLQGEVKGDTAKTKTYVEVVEGILAEEEAITTYTSSIGGSLPKFYITVNPLASTADMGQILFRVDLKKSVFSNQNDYMIYLQDKLNHALYQGVATVNQLELTESGSDFKVVIAGEDMDTLKGLADEVEKKLLETPGTINVQSNSVGKVYAYQVDIDSAMATTFGLTKYDIQNQLNLSLYGSSPTTLQLNNTTYDIWLKTNASTIKDIENLRIKSRITGNKTLLKQVAHTRLEDNLPTINRLDGRRAITVETNVISGYSVLEIGNEVEALIEDYPDKEGLQVKYFGQKETMDNYLSGLDVAALFSLAIIYIILLLQFNSYKQPFVILITVPLSLIGSILIFVLFDIKVTFTVLLGLISLIGIVVNNAILLIEYMNRARASGSALEEACMESVDKRFRPIMLSTVTTVMGLVPLALSGSSFFSPMAIALMGGLMVSTVLTLVIIPVVYALVEKE
ncbi:efflux RND transporter permease subunit [Vallitalea pronyensis]|uniref:Efflux RND transporter permease subunit n=1 Tax=Vallitalea pronyensis TaxID=1348613 RepID=A0A8J8MJ23_9FIRM|nr:efflux RND transporter permease subunit [Vallitalea pronyensis]QUI22366.1 efflux RND transporter permease subunit [Vallitalea pronyensis]